MRSELSSANRRRRLGTAVCLTLSLAAFAWALIPASARAGSPATVDFRRDILPILSDNCFRCHGPDAQTRKADLRLDVKESALRAKEPVILTGKSAESELFLRISSKDAEEVMPPPKSGKSLTAAQIELVKAWIDQGAPWSKHWAFETPRRSEPPRVHNESWPRNPIDRFVLAKLEAEGIKPSAEADRTTLIRRLSLDLTGLPPTLREVDAFLGDRSPKAYENLVDRLLASPHYGERMAMDWLDDARYADTNGYQNDFARTMWPWRDWVIAAYNRNLPFNQFVVEQMAGDLLPGATLEQKVATGFNRNNRTVTEAGSIDEEWRIENAVDRVETTATVFLGLTMGCARCHDHKFDPVSQKEFYQFLGFFNSLNEKGVYTETRGNVPPLVSVPRPEDKERMHRLDEQIAAAEKLVKEKESALADRQRSWEQEQNGAPRHDGPRDWTLRLPLDGDLKGAVESGKTIDARFPGKEKAAWTEGLEGKALRLDGKFDSFVEVQSSLNPDRGDHFSYGAWVRPRADGAILSKMDDQNAYRGFDLLIGQDKVQVHLVHAWPNDAIKVTTKETLPKDTWSHVFVTYDGSGKASGLAVYISARRAEVEVNSDTLKGSAANGQPLRLGRRSTSSPLSGDLADVRLYKQTLSPAGVHAVAGEPMIRIARIPAEKRSKVQQELLARFFRDRFAPELRESAEKLAQLRKERSEAEKTIPTVMVMEDMPKPRETFVLKRGRYDMPDKTRKVEPGVPECMPSMAREWPRNRLGLARWLVSPENPLTARVTVNRLWEHHFGVGLVKTAENFGVQSEPPSHPELLDWLATELIRSGWDIKEMHRLIVASATYRQTSKATAPLLHRDPENRLLARGPRFRLPAETVRDNALAISGLLVDRVGGPSIKPYQPAGLWEELAGGAGEGPYVQDKGPDLYRRSLYIYRKRTVPHPTMATFDAPSREICQVKRPRTNTPLQALELLNDVTYVEAARHLAELMLSQGGQTPEERIAFAFRKATARKPAEAELKLLTRGLERYRQMFAGDKDAAFKFVRHGESPVDSKLDISELAAYTASAGVILNLDETITRE